MHLRLDADYHVARFQAVLKGGKPSLSHMRSRYPLLDYAVSHVFDHILAA